MLRRLMAALCLTAVAFVLTVQGQPPATPAKKTGRELTEIKGDPKVLTEDSAVRQAALKRAFESFRQRLAIMAGRLENGSDKDKEKAKALRQALKTASDLGTEAKFDALIRELTRKGAHDSIDALKQVTKDNADLRKDLQKLIGLLTKDDSQSNKEQMEKMAKLLEQLKELIAKQERVRAQTEMGRKDTKDLKKDQNKVTRETREVADGRKGPGEEKNKDYSRGEFKGEGNAGEEGRGEARSDTDSKGESKPNEGNGGESKAGEGKPGEGQGKEGKAGEGKDGEGKPGEGKGGEGKDGEGKGGEGKGGEGKEGKPGEGKGGDGKGGEGKAGEGKEGKGAEGKGGEGKAGEGKPGEGKGGEGKGAEGKPGQGKPGEGKGGEGKPGEGKGGEGKGGEGKPGEGKGGEGKGGQGKGREGKPGEGKPGAGKPGEGKGGEGKPSAGKPGSAEGKPGGSRGQGEGKGEGKPGKPSEGKGGSESKPGKSKSESKGGGGSGKPGEGKPSGGGGGGGEGGDQPPPEDNPVKKQLEDANKYQKQAEIELDKKKKEDATDNQTKAIKELEAAKKKLEELLKQMREEEIERILADLEKRCRYMLALQIEVRDGTVTLSKDIDKTPEKKPDVTHSARSNKLADKEDEIVREADAALKIIQAEGTAVAFGEVFTQVRKDMENVRIRLTRTEVGSVTVQIENDIIDTLTEMIAALQKAQKDMKQQQGKPKPGQSGPPQNQQLIDQLAELKMIYSMQKRVNARTETYGKQYKGEQAPLPETATDPREREHLELVQRELKDLSGRQENIRRVTRDIATGKNQAK